MSFNGITMETPSANPFFTVVIPTFNRAHLLSETVESVLNQTCQDFETIIVDDGSTDNTREVVEREFGTSPRVRYIWQEHAERGAARNAGVASSRGVYVIFLDSDDLMLPEHLVTLKDAAEEQPTVNFLATKFRFLRNGDILDSPLSSLQQGYYGVDFLARGNPFGCNFCIKRRNGSLRLFQHDREYSVGEDWMFLIQNMERDRLFLIDKHTLLVREHPGRSMNSDNAKIIRGKLKAASWVEKNVVLTQHQRAIVQGHTYFFCAVHSYLGSSVTHGLRFWLKALTRLGPKREVLVLLLKLLLGRRWVQRIAGLLGIFNRPAPARTS